jgi:hypothetical protein
MLTSTLKIAGAIMLQALLPYQQPLECVYITQPTSEAIAYATVELQAETIGEASAVIFHIASVDDVKITRDLSAEYKSDGNRWNAAWSSEEFPDGVYSIVAIAMSGIGQQLASEPVLFTIRNAPDEIIP